MKSSRINVTLELCCKLYLRLHSSTIYRGKGFGNVDDELCLLKLTASDQIFSGEVLRNLSPHNQALSTSERCVHLVHLQVAVQHVHYQVTLKAQVRVVQSHPQSQLLLPTFTFPNLISLPQNHPLKIQIKIHSQKSWIKM